jgi:hypothetical protein
VAAGRCFAVRDDLVVYLVAFSFQQKHLSC